MTRTGICVRSPSTLGINPHNMMVKRCERHSGRILDARICISEVNETPSDLPPLRQSRDLETDSNETLSSSQAKESGN